ncbi:hypothetical protein TWF506_008487 [Arthrobotrys conoides]|uniref:Ubiquitin-like protease family profile domain-containing protein n=1 Tax=Arthrobotrys conoides TaxID=74498 RepID=A0AAN8NMC4_9PEZI
MIAEAVNWICQTIGVSQPSKDTFGEAASMPLDGDRIPAGELVGSSTRQAEERKKISSSPNRRPAQGIHRSGNPRGAIKIVVGGPRPQNNLNISRGSSAANYQQQGYSQPRKRPKPSTPQLTYSMGRTNPRSSPSFDLTEDIDQQVAGSNGEPTNGYGSHSPKTRRGPQGHPMLLPLQFQPERQTDHGVSFADKSEDTVKWVRKRQGERDEVHLEGSRATKKRAAEDYYDVRWENPSSSDPQPTTFGRKTRQVPSSPVSVGPGRPRKSEPAKSEHFLHPRTVWRGKICIKEGSPYMGLIVRVQDTGISVVKGPDIQPNLSSMYENIEHAAYLGDDDNLEFRNFVFLKLKNRENGLASGILLEFRALPEPVNPSQKSDSAQFRLWLEERRVKIEPKNHQFMQKRMEETKQHQFTQTVSESPGAPWQNSGLTYQARPITPKLQLREVDRPRTRSNPIPLDEHDSHWQDHQQLGTERPTRKSARTTYKKEVVEIPKPKPAPFPHQTWNQTLKFPFETQGPSGLLDASSLRTLNHDEFLNDEIINFHLAIVKARLAKENSELALKVYIANTYLFSAFSTKTETGQFNYEKVKRWTKNANLFQKDLIFIPINEKYHWFVAVVCNLPATLEAAKAREKKAAMTDELVAIEPAQKPKPALKNRPVPPEQCAVAILDSMVGYHTATLKAVKTYLISEAKEKQNVTLDLEDFTGLMPRKLPGQDNFSDCGLFMLHYIEKWLSEPTRIKEKLYERDFGSEEDARNLWSISEVANKRERMWRLYVKLNEEYEKCLKKEAFNEFPEIVDALITQSESLDEKGAGAVATERPTNSPLITQDLEVTGLTEAAKRSNSPAKRKSDGRDEADRPPKRAKSDSPVVVAEQPRVTAAPGLRPRMASPEIPLSDDVPCVLEVPETQEDVDLQRRVRALEASDMPLIAANGLISHPSPGNSARQTTDMFEQIEQMGNFNPPSAKRQAIATTPQSDSIATPSHVAAASFGDLSIDSRLDYQAESRGADPTKSDTTMHDAVPRKAVEEIEETEDEDFGELTYNGKRSKGKSIHELENDRIMDTPSSQDHREESNPPSHKHKQPNTPRRGTVGDPICIDSQSSPKRTSPRTKTTKATKP